MTLRKGQPAVIAYKAMVYLLKMRGILTVIVCFDKPLSANQAHSLPTIFAFINIATWPYILKAFLAIATAPSKLWDPPMKPEAWTKMHPGMPETSDSFSSLKPLHSTGKAFRLSKLPGRPTACTLYFPSLSCKSYHCMNYSHWKQEQPRKLIYRSVILWRVLLIALGFIPILFVPIKSI